MVEFIRKRLQVFVSSTYTDLRDQRQAAVEAILMAGHIPAGMELFAAGDESQMEVIKQWIDESDVYLLILGGRYGSIDSKSGKSYTQLEYEYAVDHGKPIFSCVITDEALEARVKEEGSRVLETAHSAELAKFRNIVCSRTVRFWEDLKDIKLAIGESMAQLSRREDLAGWVRATPEFDPTALAAEIGRLSSENARLQSVGRLSAVEPLVNGLTFSEVKELLERKDILEVFYSIKHKFDRDNQFDLMQYEQVLAQLSGFGLVHRSIDSNFRLTDAGKLFLTKLELERLRNKQT
jgi:hypothetical protein